MADIGSYHPEVAVAATGIAVAIGTLSRGHRHASTTTVILAPAGFVLVAIALGHSPFGWRLPALALALGTAGSVLPWWPADGVDVRAPLVLTVLGLCYSVPDTEAIVPVAGFVVGLASTLRRPPPRAWLAAAVLVGLAAWWGARSRPTVLIGASTMVGALVLVPALHHLRRPLPRWSWVVAAHLLCVVMGTVSARHLRHSGPLVAAAMAFAYLAAAGLVIMGGRRRHPSRRIGSTGTATPVHPSPSWMGALRRTSRW